MPEFCAPSWKCFLIKHRGNTLWARTSTLPAFAAKADEALSYSGSLGARTWKLLTIFGPLSFGYTYFAPKSVSDKDALNSILYKSIKVLQLIWSPEVCTTWRWVFFLSTFRNLIFSETRCYILTWAGILTGNEGLKEMYDVPGQFCPLKALAATICFTFWQFFVPGEIRAAECWAAGSQSKMTANLLEKLTHPLASCVYTHPVPINR